MQVTLNHATPLQICSDSIRQCWQSQDKSDNGGPVDLALIDRIGNKFKHASTLEHISLNFTIEGVSRALLQELARHRMASLSVKSSRYTLTELRNEEPFIYYDGPRIGDEIITDEAFDRASKYLVFTRTDEIDRFSIRALENLRKSVGVYSNDIIKYCMPESYKTSLSWTINARSLQNFLALRSNKAALWEIRDLAQAIFDNLPEDHKYLFEHCLSEN
jgi:thymidylate synthase (FAD)